MKKLRLITAIIAAKTAILASKLLGKKGSSAPGSIALKICPDILKQLSSQVRREIIAVCGTNGKTTTNNLLYSFITSKGYKAVCNFVGANMLYGVCCAFADSADIFGRLDADYACIEVDEASCVKVFGDLQPSKMIISNLFRDQLDRYGEIDITINYIRRALELSPNTELILNGDDPLVAQFGENTSRKCVYVGVDEDAKISRDETKEGRFCTICGGRLDYEYYHYSQLGKFSCPSCGFKRRELDFAAHNIDLSDGISFDLDFKGTTRHFDVNYRGFYNIYNIIMSYCAAVLTVGDVEEYETVLSAYKPQIGRMEEFLIGESRVILNLSKNPAGFNQAITTVVEDTAEKNLLIAINDNGQDGKDISWLWDVDFERLIAANTKKIIISGIRCDDMALRLKYAGMDMAEVIKLADLKAAAQELTDSCGCTCYALVNYTAVFKMQDIFKAMEKGGETA